MKKRCKLIAEIGWNFIGEINLAKEMISAAKESGADFAKFQTWSTKNLKPGPWDKDGRLELYKKAEISEDQHFELSEYCKKTKIKFLTSVFNIDYLKFLKKIKNDTIKVASMEINNIELLKALNKNYSQILVSTGASKISEVKKVLEVIERKKCVLMHCVSSYPTPPENINLPRINVLKKINKRVGYSGHLKGISDALASLVYEPEYIEKHFTTDNNLPGRDNKFSILPSEMLVLSKYINEHEKINIFRGEDYQDIELDVRKNYRSRWSKKISMKKIKS
jgi:N,N'-diacetyllegionaminate synthase